MTVIIYSPLRKEAEVVELDHGASINCMNVVYAEDIPHLNGSCEWCNSLIFRIRSRQSFSFISQRFKAVAQAISS